MLFRTALLPRGEGNTQQGRDLPCFIAWEAGLLISAVLLSTMDIGHSTHGRRGRRRRDYTATLTTPKNWKASKHVSIFLQECGYFWNVIFISFFENFIHEFHTYINPAPSPFSNPCVPPNLSNSWLSLQLLLIYMHTHTVLCSCTCV